MRTVCCAGQEEKAEKRAILRQIYGELTYEGKDRLFKAAEQLLNAQLYLCVSGSEAQTPEKLLWESGIGDQYTTKRE
ncbi:MAG: hypothetical protein LBG72_02135 [Spirochaetaceae bacterium]|jgi:hypothetical protein|nr:hypothetical protein [Spirochaetaceae bacterium]